MRVMGIDTSTFTGGVALVSGDEIVVEYSATITRSNSESLACVCERLLAGAGWAAPDLDGIAVTVGPGSFTGVRIGVTMAKVLGYALELPIGPVVTLDAIAANLPFSGGTGGLVCPLISARRNLVYTATYRVSGPHPERVSDYAVRCVRDVVRSFRSGEPGGLDRNRERVLFVGDGARVHKQVILEEADAMVAIGPDWCIGPRPAVVAALGRLVIESGKASTAYDLEPFYLGRSSAEMARGEARSGGGHAQGGL